MENPGTNYATITIKPKRQESILRRHPWVFSGAIKNIDGKPGAGDWVCLRANKGALLGWGHYSPGTSIAVRIMTFGDEQPDKAWWFSKVAEAVRVRKDL